ncbi:MAG: DUF3536 domain-containing protein [bacterium]
MRYLIFHLHFYQPPRINPFVGEIEYQDSAYPFENWNERITMECYLPNTFARIFDSSNYIIDIINNLEYVSFNFGPTVLGWIKKRHLELYERILEADRKSINRLGFGNAICQVYNHVIMPLVNDFDKDIQVYWGIRDFENNFGRKPSGIWLSETAVDLKTLEKLAENGIKFTILAPHQIKRYRKIGTSEWIENHGSLPNKPFRINLPSGKSIVIFVYNSSLSHAVSFQDLLSSGEKMAKSIISEYREDNDLIVIATDGETYGHHKKFGELGLAYCIHYLLSNPSIQICNFEYYLQNVGITYEAEINENTSWSCYHGIGRWKENCGCRFNPNSTQKWRKSLKIAVDSIRNTYEAIYLQNIISLPQFSSSNITDPRRDYIDYIILRENISDERGVKSLIEDFKAKYNLPDDETAKKVINSLEIYKNILFAYTSCGWFFDDISGLEAVQNLKHLYWALLKIKDIFKIDLEPVINTILKEAQSNHYRDGLEVFHKLVKEKCPDTEKIVASYVFDKVFELNVPDCYLNRIWNIQEIANYNTDNQIIRYGKVRCVNLDDFSEFCSNYVFVYSGKLDPYIGLTKSDLSKSIENLAVSGKISQIHDLIDSSCNSKYSINHIFINCRRRIIRKLIQNNVSEIDSKIDQIFSEQKNIIRSLIEANYYPIPLEMKLVTLLILDNQIEKAIENYDETYDYDEIFYFVKNKSILGLELDEEKIKRKFELKLKQMLIELKQDLFKGQSVNQLRLNQKLDRVIKFIDFGNELELKYNLWESQNIMFEICKINGIDSKILCLANRLKIRFAKNPV